MVTRFWVLFNWLNTLLTQPQWTVTIPRLTSAFIVSHSYIDSSSLGAKCSYSGVINFFSFFSLSLAFSLYLCLTLALSKFDRELCDRSFDFGWLVLVCSLNLCYCINFEKVNSQTTYVFLVLFFIRLMKCFIVSFKYFIDFYKICFYNFLPHVCCNWIVICSTEQYFYFWYCAESKIQNNFKILFSKTFRSKFSCRFSILCDRTASFSFLFSYEKSRFKYH